MFRLTRTQKYLFRIFLLVIVVCSSGLTSEGLAEGAPTITNVSPTNGPIGTVVTITGTGFSTTAANNYVYFGAVRANVTVATATSLTVAVPAGATLDPISVMTGGLTGYSASPFVVTFSGRRVLDSTSFAPRVDFLTHDPYNVALGDIDGDGKPDLMVSNQFDTTISVFRNISTSGTINSGSLASAAIFRVGRRPVSVTYADLDGDGKPDLVVPNFDASTISILRNTSTIGTISFATQITLPTDVGVGPFNTAVQDLNGDGKPDIAVANDVGGTVSVYQNQSTPGTLTASSFATRVNFTSGADPFVEIADIDGDGKPDLVTANWGNNTASVFRNLNTGGAITTSSFAARVNFATGTNPFSIAVGDIDKDGKLDLVTANENTGNVSVLRNTSTSGTVSFATKVDYTTAAGSRFAAINDLDGDNKLDIAVCNRVGSNISLLKNQSTSGSISFLAAVNIGANFRIRNIVAGDVDGDGRPELYTANEGTVGSATNNVSVFRNLLGNGFTITATAGANGTINPSGSVSVNSGSNQTFTITANSGYHIDSVIVDGASQGPVGSYTFTNVTANHTISATFAPNQLIITASAGANGTINPSGPVNVNFGSNQAFTITANSGYHIDSLIVDGVNQAAAGSYTFTNVTANHTIRATFAINQFAIISTSGANGTISPLGTVNVNSGSNQTFTITPNASYHIDSLIVDGVNQAAAGSYTFTNVTAVHTIRATFAINQYTITATAGANGTINPTGAVIVNSGSNRGFTITANSGYHIDSVIVDGVNQGGLGTYTFTNVITNHAIRAAFAINQYSITATSGLNGAISPNGIVTVNHGANQSFTMTPNSGYHIDSVIADGVNQGSPGSYTFTNVTSTHTIRAVFAIDPFASSVRMMLTASSTEASRNLFWGVHNGASAGIWGIYPQATSLDSLEGEFELPPVLNLVFDVRFVNPQVGNLELFGNGSMADFRNLVSSTQIDSYKVSLQPGTTGLPLTLKWSKTLLTSSFNGSVILKDNLGSSVDMKLSDSLVIANPAITFVWIISQSPNLPVLFEKGWNLVSVPVNVADGRKTTLFPMANSKALSFDMVGGFTPHDTVEPGPGYWLKFPGVVQSLSIAGTPRVADTIDVTDNWNLIGALSVPVSSASITTIPPGIILSNIYGFNSTYFVADTLKSYKAYWVETSQSGKIILNGTEPASLPKSVHQPLALESFGQSGDLTIRDAAGKTQRLYIGRAERIADIRRFDMPPAPPPGAFDVRFASQRMMEVVSDNRLKEFPITMSGAAYPVTVQWSSSDNLGSISLSTGVSEYDLTREGSIVLTQSSGDNGNDYSNVVFSIGTSLSIPTQFVLDQNYPNPFNPTTRISYSLPEDAQVSLKIFTVLGQEVKTLFNGMQDAGSKFISWDATNNAGEAMGSGIYFYRLEARSLDQVFTQVRKMMIVK